MKDFYDMMNLNRYKESQLGLLENSAIFGARDMQYPTEQERDSLSTIHNGAILSAEDMKYPCEHAKTAQDKIPDEVIKVIQKFDISNPKVQSMDTGYNELVVDVPVRSDHIEWTLLYALNSGTAYKIKNENIYIWYKPSKGLENAGYYKLKRFKFIKFLGTIKYFLDGSDKLPNLL